MAGGAWRCNQWRGLRRAIHSEDVGAVLSGIGSSAEFYNPAPERAMPRRRKLIFKVRP